MDFSCSDDFVCTSSKKQRRKNKCLNKQIHQFPPLFATACCNIFLQLLICIILRNCLNRVCRSSGIKKAFASSLVLSPGYIRFRAANLRLFQEHRALSCRLSQVNDLATRAP